MAEVQLRICALLSPVKYASSGILKYSSDSWKLVVNFSFRCTHLVRASWKKCSKAIFLYMNKHTSDLKVPVEPTKCKLYGSKDGKVYARSSYLAIVHTYVHTNILTPSSSSFSSLSKHISRSVSFFFLSPLQFSTFRIEKNIKKRNWNKIFRILFELP